MPTPVISLKGRIREFGPRLERAPHVAYLGRPMNMGGWRLAGSPLANPFRIGPDCSREESVARYRQHLLARPDLLALLPDLRGRTLGCWCHPEACHVHVVVAELVDALDQQEVKR